MGFPDGAELLVGSCDIVGLADGDVEMVGFNVAVGAVVIFGVRR